MPTERNYLLNAVCTLLHLSNGVFLKYYSNKTFLFYVTLTVHLSITLVKTNLTHNIFVLQYVYYIPLHVSSSNMLIIRRLNCIDTASEAAPPYKKQNDMETIST
jgi:hypothetical protein